MERTSGGEETDMHVKLKVTKKDDAEWSFEQEFDQGEVAIGRDLKSDLKLGDTSKIVSRHHAAIKKSADEFTVIDLESQNFTYLNDKKLKPKVSYPLKNGDSIKIGGYRIDVVIEKAGQEPLEKTLLSPERPNPFIKDLQDLAEVLKRISHTYEKEVFGGKNEALKAAVEEVIADFPADKAFEIMKGTLSGKTDPLSSPPVSDEAQLKITHENGRIIKFISIMLGLLADLIQARKEFRLEFLGETIVGSGSKFSLQDCTAEQLRDHYFTSDIAQAEFEKRFKSLRTLADGLKHHQLSLFEGYKAAVSEGARQMVKKFDPQAVEEKIKNMTLNLTGLKIPLYLFPFMKHVKFKQIISDSFGELLNEDLSIIEKEYFRSGYIQGYYRRMDQLKGKNSKP